ncbi:MAG: hypothetical protein R6U43_02415 [Candidatus Krumholzibacteriales bacterium]
MLRREGKCLDISPTIIDLHPIYVLRRSVWTDLIIFMPLEESGEINEEERDKGKVQEKVPENDGFKA